MAAESRMKSQDISAMQMEKQTRERQETVRQENNEERKWMLRTVERRQTEVMHVSGL
jgi:hypothetical protein